VIDEVSIVIPALNEEKYLPKLLTSIGRQDYQGNVEVIVVDGNSSDKTVIVAKQFIDKVPQLSILTLKRKGIGYQRNKGAARAKYKYLLFLDADMILPPQFLSKFLNKVRVDEQFVSTVNVWVAEKDILSYIIFAIMYPLFYLIAQKEKVLPGFLFLTTKEQHEKIGGFREDLPMAEDVDYGWRSVAFGAKYHFYFTPVALHSARRMRKRGRIKFFYDYLRVYYFVKTQGLNAAIQKIHYPFGEYD
jgi:glycosyltransferase involved in cell wall biosynthesis